MTYDAPQDASVALSPSRCGFFAAPLARPVVSPARQTVSQTRILKPRCARQCVYILPSTAKGSHNPLLEADELLLFLLSALEVNLDQSLQLHQVLLHPFSMDVLQTEVRHPRYFAHPHR